MSKLVTSPVRRGVALRRSVLGMAVAAALALPQLAAAMDFDTGSDNLSFRWDNTLRVSFIDRVSSINKDMVGNVNYDDGDRNFKNGSIWTRFDVLSEMDLVWKQDWGKLGARVSAAGWWDPGYNTLDNNNVQTSNALSGGFPTLKLTDYSNRYAKGPSGEFLDWFLFGQFDAAGAPTTIRVGQTTVFWGESLLFNGAIHGIAYDQNPIDAWKGLATPGAEAKELFRPRLGANIQSQVTDTVNVALQYFFNWQQFSNQAWRYPESGTFLSVQDPALWGADSIVYAPSPLYGTGTGAFVCGTYMPGDPTCASQQWLRFWRGKDSTPDENSNNYGIAIRWAPEWVDGTLGFYYRRTYDMQPQAVIHPDIITGIPSQTVCGAYLSGFYLGGGQCLQNSVDAYLPSPPYPAYTPAPGYLNQTGTDFLTTGRIGTYNMAFGSDMNMFGISLSKQIGSVSMGAELGYRTDMPLLSDPVLALPTVLRDQLGAPLPAGAVWADKVPKHDTPGAKGDTMHGVLNFIGIMGESLWDTASWQTELTWMQWLNVTQNEAVFKGRSNHIVYYPGTETVDTSKSWSAYTLADAVDKNYFGLAMNFTPTWFQVRPGMDVLAPLSWSQGISGNSAITSGGQQGAGSFGLGIALDFYQKYRFDLKYVGFYGNYGKCKNDPASFCAGASPNAVSVFNGTNAVLSDRDFIALTFKATF
jgi:hypothetical protein